ncbi:MBL fold metallo-hydrolase [Salipiger aestuarii]|uniref:MBL fold metallo-hydrolase n=1 Tax=Salipiger aestuarii TaxID=568098 RepID=UPI00123AC5D9|nr:MBL fold metallo-hydrolase [Salipiger aestuarii]KAA8610225.1 metallo-beta-lactamase [Salipiger aestuarii]
MQDPQPEFAPVPGDPVDLAPGLRRILAPNPSAMTFRGTNTYLVGDTDIAVIDPGPDHDGHLDAILSAIGGAAVRAILVTHAHLDHSPLSRRLSQATNAPVCAFGDAVAGRSERMARLVDAGLSGGGEGTDHGFVPDVILADGETVSGADWTLQALHTPGHFGNHLSFAWQDALFSGDLVMGWASSLVSPPDGDMSDYMAALDRLSQSRWSVFYPGHGAPITETADRLSDLVAHRRSRETQILDALHLSDGTAPELVGRIYSGVPASLVPAAARNVLAHLLDLQARNHVTSSGDTDENPRFSLSFIKL